MPSFRNFLFVLVAVATVFATVASAQMYSCNGSAVPTLVRSEGIAELAGDILLVCSGTVLPAGIVANVRVRLNTNVTSNVLSGPTQEGILLLDEMSQSRRGVGAVNPTVYQATKISDPEVQFTGVILAPPGSAGAQTIRITNLRANASALGSYATIFATVNIIGSTTVPVNNNSLVVANSRPGLKFSVTPASYNDCQAPSGPFTLRFEEGFASAFRPAGDADVDNTTAGGAYPNESGFNPTPLASGTLTALGQIGQATQGTRLMARLSSVPPGVSLSAPERVWVNTMRLQAVTGTDANGSGGTVTSGSGSVSISDKLVYEVIELQPADLATVQTVTVNVTPSYSIPGPLGSAMVKGSFAPLSFVFTASAAAPEPRFADYAVNVLAFSISPCIPSLIGLVQNLGSPGGPLNSGQVNSLVKKLEHVLEKLDRTQTKTACNELQAFVNQVSAFVAGGVLTGAQGNELISLAQQIGNTIPCDY